MKQSTKFAALGAIGALAVFAALPAWAQAPAPAPTVNKGDTAWMMTSTVLVLMMILPPAGFLVLGLLLATKRVFERRGARAAAHQPAPATAPAVGCH